MKYKFTARAEKALEIANEMAIELGHNYIGTEHLLYGLVKEGNGIASKVLENQGVTEEKVIDKIEELLEELKQKEIITEKQKAAVPKQKILMFTKSNIFKELSLAKEVYKEQPFYINIPLDELYKIESDEKILVQGIIDLYYISQNGNLVLVDYKTDFVPDNDEQYLIQKYSNQLNLYKRALEQALNRKVDKVYIYSTYLEKEISL